MSDDAPLSPRQRSTLRRLARAPDAMLGDEAGELNVDPYLDIITNILVFSLATISIVFLAGFDAKLPAGNGPRKGLSRALDLVMLVGHRGVAFTTSEGHIAPGCGDEAPSVGGGVTIPNSGANGDAYDWARVTRCARSIKEANSDARAEREVTISANPDVSYGDLIHAIDAVRADPQGELFPDVHFAASPR